MDKQDEENLDAEFTRYLEIMRSHLDQILDKNIMEICNDWIQKLCQANSKEKVLRNKYTSNLCYQLARGTLEEPFVSKPTFDRLPPLPYANHDESSTELEYILVDLENTRAHLNYEDSSCSITGVLSKNSNVMKPCVNETKSNNDNHNVSHSIVHLDDHQTGNEGFFPIDFGNNFQNMYYQSRIKNLVFKLRDLKQQNLELHEELTRLKENCAMRDEYDDSYEDILKVDASTSAFFPSVECLNSTKSLKCKLEDVQASRNVLIENITTLKNTLDDYDDMKRFEIEDIQAKHKLEIINIESNIKEELKVKYEQKLAETIKQYEESLTKKIDEIKNITATKDEIINLKNEEINRLNSNIVELKQNLSQISTTQKTDLEKYLNNCKISKSKYCKAYEEKILNLKKEKHLTECFLQLQIMKQRAQITKEITDAHQVELTKALEKLENKYKDIIANVQATAVQRRFLDQMTLGSLIQTVCGARKEDTHNNRQTQSVLIHDSVHNQVKVNKVKFSGATQENIIGSVIVGKDSEDLVRYCTDGEKMVELFEKSHIPQRDCVDV